MADIKLNTALVTNMEIIDRISSRSGISVYAVRSMKSEQLYVLKHISVPETQNQVDALILTGAAADKEAAQAYYEQVVTDYREELEKLEELSASPNISSFRSYEIKPKEDAVGFDLFLLAEYKTTLESYLSGNALSHRGAVDMAIDLCNALIDLRAAGLIHRDVKPANIYMNSQGHFMIGDLGLAQIKDLKYCSMPELMISAYSAPELFELMSTVNETVDLYSIGLILYRIYNGGHAPFEDERTTAKAADKLRISGQELPAPMFADYEMAEIIRKACACKPEDRYQTPEEMKQVFVDYMMRNQVGDEPITPPIVVDEAPISEEAVHETVEPVQFTTTEELDETFKESFAPDSDMLNALIESVHKDIENDYTAVPTTPYIDTQGSAQPKKRKRSKIWIPIVASVAAILLIAFAVWFFLLRKDTITINSMEIVERTTTSISVDLVTEQDPGSFRVICTDAYGNVQSQGYVPGTPNIFEDLVPGAQYVFSVEGYNEEHVAGAVPFNASTKTDTKIISLSVSRETVSQIELNFIPEGNEPDEWSVSYSAAGQEAVTKTFTGHTVTLTGLEPDTEYTITLLDPSDVQLSGVTTVQGKTLASVHVTDIYAELTKSTAIITWEYEGDTPASWNVTTTGSEGYTNNQTVLETELILDDLKAGETYSLVITCDNMVSSASTNFTPEAFTISEISAQVNENGNIDLSWNCEIDTEDVEWMVVYTMVGNEDITQVEKTTEQTVTLTSLIPGCTYSIEIQESNGEEVGGENTIEVEVPAVESFTGYGFSKGLIVMWLRPEQEDWTANNLQTSKTTFTAKEKVAFACQTTTGLKDSDDVVTTLLVVRDANGSVIDYYTGEETWNNMWTQDTYVGELLRTPEEPGKYTIELYFNGKRVKTDADVSFTITQ